MPLQYLQENNETDNQRRDGQQQVSSPIERWSNWAHSMIIPEIRSTPIALSSSQSVGTNIATIYHNSNNNINNTSSGHESSIFRLQESSSSYSQLERLGRTSAASGNSATASRGGASDTSNRNFTVRSVASRRNASGSNASIHPNFRSKSVYILNCEYCGRKLCDRAMKAILLADTRVELYSTDSVPCGRVQLVADNYTTRNCLCSIRDTACLGCGNVLGYNVTQPCSNCLNSCNNGHFWMFHNESISAAERMGSDGKKLQWAHLEKEVVPKDPKNLNAPCR